jgi:hypothetical protein
MKPQNPASVYFSITIFYGKQEQKFEHCTVPFQKDSLTWFRDSQRKLHAVRGCMHAVEET